MNIQCAFLTTVVGIVLPFFPLLAKDVMDAPSPGYHRQIEQLSPLSAISFTQIDVEQTSEFLQLDHSYYLSLKRSSPEAFPFFEILPPIPPQPNIVSPLTAPDGLPLWRGARRFEFNGRPFYLIPL